MTSRLSAHTHCYASGDPHFNTFDRKMIHFMGVCVYTLSQVCPSVNTSLPRFNVEIKVPCVCRKNVLIAHSPNEWAILTT